MTDPERQRWERLWAIVHMLVPQIVDHPSYHVLKDWYLDIVKGE